MTDTPDRSLTDEQLRALLNAQTARIPWEELEPHFQRGAVIEVSAELDLVEVAVAVVRDERARVQSWMGKGRVSQPTGATADRWRSEGACLWAVVTAPWVLVQERG